MQIKEINKNTFLQEMKEFLARESVKLPNSTKIELIHNTSRNFSNPCMIVKLGNEKYMGSVTFWSNKTGEVILLGIGTEVDNFQYGFSVEHISEAKEQAQKVLTFFEKPKDKTLPKVAKQSSLTSSLAWLRSLLF